MPIKCPFCKNTIPASLINSTPKKQYKELFVTATVLHLRAGPSTDHDIIGRLKHGDGLTPIDDKNGWFKVPYEGQIGWISGDWVIIPEEVKPENDKKDKLKIAKIDFKTKRPHKYNSEKTKKLRQIINDEFGGELKKWDLQCTEYTHYRIKLEGHTIKWPKERPQHGGRWAKIFEKTNYKVSDKPIKGTAMSFTGIIKYGDVAYVEKVNKDGSVFISEANWPKDGIYCERTISLERQKQYGAKFIKFV